MRRILAVVLVAGMFGLCSPPAMARSAMAPAEVISLIKASGARSFLDKYFSTDIWYDSVLAGIERAEPEWLEVGVMLRRESDAGSSEELGLALYSALAKKPLVALPALLRVYGGTAKDLCTQTFEAEIPKQGISSYLREIERGLSKAISPEEIALAKGCREGIAATRRYVKDNRIK